MRRIGGPEKDWTTAHRALWLVSAVLVLGCHGQEVRTPARAAQRPPSSREHEPAPLVRIVLREIARFGLEDDTLPHGGAALAAIAAIAEACDSTLYVLDAGFKKVVAFSPDGAVRRIILGGHGEGPGEMMHPIALDVTEDGRVAVFDYRLNRVTLFSATGSILGTEAVPRAKTILVRGDTVWGTNMPGRDHLLWRHVFGHNSFDDQLPTNPRDRDFAPNGSVGWIARGLEGQMLVARNRPGIWMVHTASGFEMRGAELLSENHYRVVGNFRIPLGGQQGFGVLASGRIVLAYLVRDFDRPTPHSDRPYTPVYHLAVFSATGLLEGELAMGEEPVTALATSRLGEFLFLARRDPFPQVVKYAIELARDSS